MRDIRPRRRKPGTLPKKSQPATGAAQATPKLSGATVPVANVHVNAAKGSARARQTTKAPLFYKRKKTVSRKARIRVGQRERYAIVGGLALVAIAVLLAGVIFWPKAEVKMILRTSPLLVEQPLVLQADSAAEPGDQTVVPGTSFFRELDIASEAPVASTEVVGTIARGTVTIVNRAIEPQSIVERSRLVTDGGDLFYLIEAARVAANSQVSATVEAAEAGSEGNLAPQRLNFAALPESAQSLIYAEVETALTGGSGEMVHVVKEADIEQAKTLASQRARETVAPDIRDELPEGWVILEESWTVETESFETDVAMDDRAPVINYSGRMVVRVLGYEQAALDSALEQALNAKLDQDFMLFPSPISYTTRIEEVNWDDARARVLVRVTHTTIPRLSLDSLREKLAGRSEEDALKYLEGLPGVRSAELTLSPFWVRSVPRIEKRILLDLQPEQQPI